MWRPNPEIYYSIVQIFPDASWKYALIIAAILTICGIILFFLLEYSKRKQTMVQNTPSKKQYLIRNMVQIIIGSISLLAMFYLICGIQTLMQAHIHGMYQNNMSWKNMVTAIENTPVEDTLPDNPEDLQNSIILYYRFGCSDCEATFKEEQAYFQGLDDVYWISTRSEQGKELLKQYPVQHVPAGVYITDTNAGITRTLYLDTDKNVEFHSENAQELITLHNGSHTN